MANPLGNISKLISSLKMKYHRESLEKEEQPQHVFVAQETNKKNRKGPNGWKPRMKTTSNTNSIN